MQFGRSFLVFAVLLYVIPSFFLPVIFDVKLFETVGVKILERTDFYAFDRPTHGTFPFLPLLVWPYAVFHFLSLQTGLEFVVFVRLFVTAFVFGILFLIPKRTRFLFIFNPIIYLTAVLHGQADMILIFFVLLSVHFQYLRRSFLAGFFMAISTFVKNWSVIFLPLFLLRHSEFISESRSRNKFGMTGVGKFGMTIAWLFGFLGTAGVLLGVYIRLLHSNLNFIFEAFKSHTGGAPGYWGMTGILNLFGLPYLWIFGYSIFILAVTFGLTYLWIFFRRIDLKISMLLLVLGFLVVTPGWGIQYAAWPIPFALIAGQISKVKIYTILGTVYVFASYAQTIFSQERIWTQFNNLFIMSTIILGLPLWFFCIHWFMDILFLDSRMRGNDKLK